VVAAHAVEDAVEGEAVEQRQINQSRGSSDDFATGNTEWRTAGDGHALCKRHGCRGFDLSG
jgi:hypothetical protein